MKNKKKICDNKEIEDSGKKFSTFEVEKQYEGVEKHWIVQRFANGTYVIMFTTKQIIL